MAALGGTLVAGPTDVYDGEQQWEKAMASFVPSEPPPQSGVIVRGFAAAFAGFLFFTGYCLLRSYIETCWASLTVSSRWGASTTIAWGVLAAVLWSRRHRLSAAAVAGPVDQAWLFLLLTIAAVLADAASFQFVAFAGGSQPDAWEAMERLVVFSPRAAMLSALAILTLIVVHQRRLRFASAPEDTWLEFPEAPLLRLRTRDVAQIRSAGNYSEIDGAAGTHLVRAPISQLEQRLASRGFVRVHRQTLVNRRHVRALRRDQAGRPILLLANGRCVPVGRSYRAQVDALTSGAWHA